MSAQALSQEEKRQRVRRVKATEEEGKDEKPDSRKGKGASNVGGKDAGKGSKDRPSESQPEAARRACQFWGTAKGCNAGKSCNTTMTRRLWKMAAEGVMNVHHLNIGGMHARCWAEVLLPLLGLLSKSLDQVRQPRLTLSGFLGRGFAKLGELRFLRVRKLRPRSLKELQLLRLHPQMNW